MKRIVFGETECRGRESNPYTPYGARDFKSLASATSATPAGLDDLSPNIFHFVFYFIFFKNLLHPVLFSEWDYDTSGSELFAAHFV